jgi:asparagine synthase (glutamine-hydrolysing)
MCGIAGICALGEGISPSAIGPAIEAIRHRGPDDEGYIAYDTTTRSVARFRGSDSLTKQFPHIRSAQRESRGVVFGHRRLSIIDPTLSGHQPMSYDDGRYWIVYNGEIYNYVELRRVLETMGYAFSTATDTEVILASYAEWGCACLSRFIGMWSFALLDTETQVVFMARDRFGVKPFYYAWDGRTFAFASEIKALLRLTWVKPTLNEAKAYDFLMWGILRSSQETFFNGISELELSHCLTLDLRTATLVDSQYYSLPSTDDTGRFEARQFTAYVQGVRERLRQAVQIRLRADVPVGSCLSGGIDSSAIVCGIADTLRDQHLPHVGDAVRVFTACYEDQQVDERRYAAEVVRTTGSQWLQTFPTGNDFWRDLDRVIDAQDEPFGGPSIYAQYRVMRLAKESGVSVLLDGQGGDELFAGYPSCYAPFFLELVERGSWAEAFGQWNGLSNAPIGRRALLGQLVTHLAIRELPSALRGLMARQIMGEGRFLERDFINRHLKRDRQLAERASVSLNTFSSQLLTTYSLPLLLRHEDRNSMAWSIEARTPFVDDHPLTEYVTAIPSVFKIRNGWSKALLREAMRPALPAAIYSRRDKLGFATPESAWLRLLDEDLLRTVCGDSRFVNWEALRESLPMIALRSSKRTVYNVWRLLIFSVWRQRFGL